MSRRKPRNIEEWLEGKREALRQMRGPDVDKLAALGKALAAPDAEVSTYSALIVSVAYAIREVSEGRKLRPGTIIECRSEHERQDLLTVIEHFRERTPMLKPCCEDSVAKHETGPVTCKTCGTQLVLSVIQQGPTHMLAQWHEWPENAKAAPQLEEGEPGG